MSDESRDAAGTSEPSDPNAPPTRLSLEQALLAPLDSILKAQLHSARSFLNLLLQLGYPHQETNKGDGQPYSLEFTFNRENERQKLKVPALALVPISPLAVDSASFEMEMSARKVVKHTQIQQSEASKINPQLSGYDRSTRPWFLVDKPVNIEGDIVSTPSGESAKHRESQSAIKIKINVKSVPLPAGLDKLLTSLTNMSQIESLAGDDNPPPEAVQPAPGQPSDE